MNKYNSFLFDYLYYFYIIIDIIWEANINFFERKDFMINRLILIVMDSVGIGELPDAHKYGDEGSNTLGNISKAIGGLRLQNLERMGIGNIDGSVEYEKVDKTIGAYGKLVEKSSGKDTTTGHWEIAGLITKTAFPTYPHGFPKEIMDEFEKRIGTKTLANYPASGTEIIKQLGEEHMRTGYPIVYTSADSVFQIAANEKIIPLDKLYEMCRIAREILTGQYAVARVIARPFVGDNAENFTRTPHRKDFSLEPHGDTFLDIAKKTGLRVMSVGKIEDIFAGRGVTDAVHIVDNMDGVDKTIEYMKSNDSGIIFTNLVDFDMKFGHRNDVDGYANALVEFDNRIPEIMENMNDTDILMITADHGCDPTTPSTDHSREYIPLFVYGKQVKENVNLGIRNGFSDIGQTICDILGLEKLKNGESFKNLILGGQND